MIIVNIIASIFAVAFLCWFIMRTPENLRKWYGIPVSIAMIILVVALWLGWIF